MIKKREGEGEKRISLGDEEQVGAPGMEQKKKRVHCTAFLGSPGSKLLPKGLINKLEAI
jgi:hypothetical protein